MATLTMTRAQIRTKVRQLVGATDATKGGPVDSVFDTAIDEGINRFCIESGALHSVHKLSTKALDKYLPLIDEILWPKTVSFVDSDGRRWPLDLVEVAPSPGILGTRPQVWWLTAVNVPDVTGPSTRTIGIDPYVNLNGNGNVIIEDVQMPQVLGGDSAVPEIHGSMHMFTAYYAAIELVSLFPEKLGMVGYWENRCKEAKATFIRLTRPDAEQPHTFKDSMNYAAKARSRL